MSEDSVLIGIPELPPTVKKDVFIAGHSVAAISTWVANLINTLEAIEETGDNPFGIPSAVLGIVSGGSVGITNFLVPKDPIKNEAVSIISTATTGIRLLCKLIFWGKVQSKLAAGPGVMKKGAIFDAILVIPALACTGWHFYELSQDSAGKERTDVILEEVSNLTSYISRVSYAMAVNDKDPETKVVEIGVMAVANFAYAGLQTAEAVVH